MGNITISKLIDYYAGELNKKSEYDLDKRQGNEPNYPMLVAFTGKDGPRIYAGVESHIQKTWPQFRGEIKYLNAEKSQDGAQFFELSMKDEEAVKTRLERSELCDVSAPMFGTDSFFEDKSRFFLFYVIETTSFSSWQDFEDTIRLLKELKREVVQNGMPTREYLCILLNQNGSEREALSREILTRLRETCAELRYSALVLSNHLDDYTILGDWDSCCRIIADLILLTNNRETPVVNALWEGEVYAPRYAIQQKPVQEIGQVIIRGLIERLSGISFDTDGRFMLREDFPARLGLTEGGTVGILDEYVEQTLYRLLPGDTQLNLFPRRTSEEIYISELSEYEFNQVTMNSWRACLQQITDRAVKRISRDLKQKEEWRAQYRQRIKDTFSVPELIWMRTHIDEVRKFFSVRDVTPDGPILENARFRLKSQISSDPSMKKVFLSVIEDEGKMAEEFLQDWVKLYRSLKMLHSVRDENLITYYQRKLRLYLDSKEGKLQKEFEKIRNIDNLEEYLKSHINEVIEGDPVFRASFEEELRSRIQDDTEKTSNEYIQDRLTGDKVPIYFRSTFSLGEPVVRAVLMTSETPLYENLRQNLPPTTYFYNTGNNTAVETVFFYLLQQDNLTFEQGKESL